MAKQGTTRHASTIQEKRLNKQFGGYRPPNSGAGMFKKGDNILEDFYMDGKTSMKEVTQKTVKKAEIDEARQNAFYMRKRFSAIVLSFGDGKDYFVMDSGDIESMYEGFKVYEKLLEKVGTDDKILDSADILEVKKILRGDL